MTVSIDDLHDGDEDHIEFYDDRAQQRAEEDFKVSEGKDIIEDDKDKEEERVALKTSRFNNIAQSSAPVRGQDGIRSKWDRFRT